LSIGTETAVIWKLLL